MEGSGWEKERSKKSYNAARFSAYFVVSRAFGYNVFFFQPPDAADQGGFEPGTTGHRHRIA